MAKARINTPLGAAYIEGDVSGITKISLSSDGDVVTSEIPEELKEAAHQLIGYFEGELENFELKLNPKGTVFQKKVWTFLQEIPYGKTISYLDLSKKIGDPKAVRAVAAANGRNPVWIAIPCHRVVGSDGSLTGYAGELWRKKWLLEHESKTVQQSLF